MREHSLGPIPQGQVLEARKEQRGVGHKAENMESVELQTQLWVGGGVGRGGEGGSPSPTTAVMEFSLTVPRDSE